MTLIGHCHCRRNTLEIDGKLPEKLTRCTCSFCSKRGHLYAYYKPDQLKVTQADSDAIYRWNTKKVENHFCSACGCDLYADSPDFQPDGSWDGKTRKIAVNARLFDDFEAADWPVTTIDGKHLRSAQHAAQGFYWRLIALDPRGHGFRDHGRSYERADISVGKSPVIPTCAE